MKLGLLTGINYFDTSSELRGCINDINNVEKLYNKCGYETKNLVKLYDVRQKITDHDPTVKNMIEQCNKLVNAPTGSDLVFHYSGHGTQTYNSAERDNKDEVICLTDGYLKDDILRKLLVDNCPKDVKLRAIFDCCHSGSILDLPCRWKNGSRFYMENYQTDNKDIVMISGSLDRQYSSDAWISESQKYQGAMTWAYIKSIEYMNDNNLKWDWRDLVVKMRSYLKKSKFIQIPQLSLLSRIYATKLVDIKY